jgi:hypothetical protein
MCDEGEGGGVGDWLDDVWKGWRLCWGRKGMGRGLLVGLVLCGGRRGGSVKGVENASVVEESGCSVR